MSNNASSADNQQGSRHNFRRNLGDPSETTRQTPLSSDKLVIKAYFLGALHDGTFSSNKRFRISQKGTEWLKVLRKLLKDIGYNSWIYKEGRTRSVYVLETLADFLDFRFDPVNLKSGKEKTAYLRGFFDAEGGIPQNNKSRFYIQLALKDKNKLKKIKQILDDLSIKTGKIHNPSIKANPDYWRIYVLAESYRDFVRLIGSWHPRKCKLIVKRVKI